MNNYSNGNVPDPIPTDTTQQFVWAIKTCFNKYVDFDGRASRAEFWWWFLFTFLIDLAFCWSGWGTGLVSAAFLLPTLGVSWRRLHDTGRGGGWWFIGFIPLVGWILLIIWLAAPGENHPNRFGPNPYGFDDGQPPIVK